MTPPRGRATDPYDLVKAAYRSEHHAPYHLREYDDPRRSTVAFVEFIRETIGDPSTCRTLLDVGCGAGGMIYQLARVLPIERALGVDSAERYVDAGRALLRDRGVACAELRSGDFRSLGQVVAGERFDLVVCVQTLSWIPTYRELLREMLAVCRRALYVSSLFSSFDVDVETRVYRTMDSFGTGDECYYYNVYSLQHFEAECRRLGAGSVEARPFVIDIDLKPPADGRMGTYTRVLDTGERLQFSGPLALPWQFVRVGRV